MSDCPGFRFWSMSAASRFCTDRLFHLLFHCWSISALIFSSSLDCQDILFGCRHQLCIVHLTVIQDVSLCSRHLCLDTAGRDGDFRQRRDEGPYRRGLGPGKGRLLLEFSESLNECIQLCVVILKGDPGQSTVLLSSTSKAEGTVRWRSKVPFPSQWQDWPREAWYCSAYSTTATVDKKRTSEATNTRENGDGP